jgi:hypothetical protein
MESYILEKHFHSYRLNNGIQGQHNPSRRRKMKNSLTFTAVASCFFMLFTGSLLCTQGGQRPSWEEISPKVGKTVPDVQIYDEQLNLIPISNLYKDARLLVMQWGGCT